MKRLKSRSVAMLLVSMICFSILLSANIFKITPVKGYLTWGITNPTGIAVDGSGNVYVIDYSDSHVEKFSSLGVYLGQVDSGQLSHPFGIAVDGSSNVYVVDSNNNRVVKFLTDSSVQTWGVYGTGNGEFRYPSGIAVDGSGNVYVADTSNNRVEKFLSDGTYVSQFGSQGTGGGEFNGPYGIAVDGSGNVYVTDKGNDRVEKFLDDGTGTFPFQCQFGSSGTGDGEFNQPLGIAVDSSGYVYVADSLNDRIQEFYSSPPGLNYVFHAKWGSYGSGDYQFWTAHEVCVDSSGAVYVADFGNNRVQKFNQYTLTINKNDPSGENNYNYVLPYEGSDTIVEGTIVTQTAVATHGYVFTGWSGALEGTTNPTTITMDADKTVTANFAPAPPVITLSPSVGMVGDSVTVTGSGFAASSTITIMYEDATLATSASDSSGGFVVSFSVPASTAGSHTVFAMDLLEDSASASFTVTPAIVLSPSSGMVGDSVTVTGSGFFADIGISIFYDSAQQGSSFVSDGYGGFSMSFTVPASTAGPHTVNAFEEAVTGPAATASFTVYAADTITVQNVLLSGSVPDAWKYQITDSDGFVVDSFALAASGGDTHTFATSGGQIFTITAVPKYGYDTAISFQTDTYSHAYPDEILPNVVTVYLAIGGWAAVTFSNAAVYSPGPGYTYGSLNGVIPADLTFPFPMNKLIPVQSAWPIDKNSPADGKLDLVVNKTMAVLVNVTDASIGPSTSVTVSVTFDGAVYTDTTTTGSAQSRLIAIYPIVPKNLGDKTITGTYQMGAGSPVALTLTVVTVRDTNVLKLFFAYFTPKQSGNYAVVSPADFAAVAANITSFINATYPMKQVIVNATYTPLAGNATASSQGGAKNDLKYLANVAKLPASGLGTDAIGVAIVPDNYFTYHGYPAGVVGAMVTPSVKAAVVSQSWYTAAAHEVAHVLYSVFYPKEYYSNPSWKGTTVAGVWADKGQWRSGWDIMDYMGPADGNWIGSSLTYTYLFKNATKSIADPEILFASGSIYQDGTIKLDSWYQVAQGTPDTVVPPGNYSLNFLDQNGNSIAVTNFDASFNMEYVLGVLPGQDVDPSLDGNLVSDSASFAFATALPGGAVAVQVVNVTDPSKPVVLTTINRNDIPVVGPPPAATVNAYFTDSNFKPIGSFDVLFKPTSSKVTTLTLTATNPATYYYTLDFKNNGAALSFVPITVKVPADFVLSGTQPVQVDFSPVSYTFASGNLAVAVPNVGSGHVFTLRVHLDYKLKGTTGYLTNSPTTYSKAYTFDTTVSGASVNAPSVNAVGKAVTAIGGFVTDTSNSPQGGLRVKVYKGLTAKWSGVVDGDGYYFVEVSSGGPYSIVLYDSFGVPVWVKTGVNVAAYSYVPVDFTVLPINCAIQGFVKDSLGNPVSGVSVQLKGPLGNIQTTTTTNPGGYYEFRFILPGTYTVKITVPAGYTAVVVSKNVRVKLTDMATFNFFLAKK